MVVLVDLGSRVYHVDRLETLLVQLFVERLGVGEVGLVEGEDAVAVHVVDVHPDDVAGYVAVAEVIGNLAYLLLAAVGETALVVSQSPAGRHGDGTGQFGQTLEYGLGRLAVDDEDAEEGTLGVEFDFVGVGGEFGFPRGIEEDTECGTVAAYAHHPGVRLVEAFAAVYAVGPGIGVPQLDVLSVTQQRAGDFAAAVETDFAREAERGAGFAVDQGKLGHQFPIGRGGPLSRGFLFEDERRSLGLVEALRNKFDDVFAHKRRLRDGHIFGSSTQYSGRAQGSYEQFVQIHG